MFPDLRRPKRKLRTHFLSHSQTFDNFVINEPKLTNKNTYQACKTHKASDLSLSLKRQIVPNQHQVRGKNPRPITSHYGGPH